MITVINLSKNYGKKSLFERLSLNINMGEKIGLIGSNGSGRSTFFSLIFGEVEPTAGQIRVNKGINIGHLAQESRFNPDNTVIAELTKGDSRILQLKKEKSELEDSGKAGSSRYGEVLHELEALGFFELEHKAKKVLMGLGFKENDFGRNIHNLSGGWQMRTLLAKLLTYRYDLLLLDEPTNYLDLNAAIWLKDYLSKFQGTFIMISHDRAFLTDVTNYTLILENGTITKVRGNYEHYEEIKRERRIYLEKQFKEQERKREQLEKFISRFHAQPNKAAAVRSKRTALERLEKEAIELPPDPRESIRNFTFPQARRSGYKIIELSKVSKSYKDIEVYKDLDFEITQGEKAVLAGENGAGKSTLLKILSGVVDINSGSRILGHNVDVGYFSQTRTDVLNVENTVLREAYSAAPGYMPEESIRSILGAFLFTGDDAEKKVKVLSGGEKSRLILAKLLINPPNFLLLDEPTTHLDVDAIEALVKALGNYQGTLVFISHDIYFVRSVANTVYEVKNGRIRKFPGKFDYYLGKKDSFEVSIEPKKIRFDLKKQKQEEERLKAKEAEKTKRAEEKRRKSHNTALRIEINKLKNKKEALRIESSAKLRSLSNPKFYHDEEKAREYGKRLKEIEKIISEIDSKINALEGEIIA